MIPAITNTAAYHLLQTFTASCIFKRTAQILAQASI